MINHEVVKMSIGSCSRNFLSRHRFLSARICLPFCFLLFVLPLNLPGQLKQDVRSVDFVRDVRPILSDHCFACHGPDENTREADFRLDLEAEAKSDRGGYAGIVPGNLDDSELITRILSDDDSDLMPPPEFKKPLSKKQIAILETWVREGGSWSKHWAYDRPKNWNPLDARGNHLSATSIDRYVDRGVASAGLSHASNADPVTLIRRLSFDLTGLPPRRSLVEKYLAQCNDDTYAAIVDQLLDSHHFGERMAMYWLDLVRYADTVGYHGDQVQNISPYRDWVIQAFNQNMRFDQFTREQLAGDLLPDATLSQKVASGYNRLLQTTHEGGLQPKEYRAIYAADRVRNFSVVWLGATVGCAQCHDHKYDPYTTRDFYSLSAFFADIDDERHFRVGTNSNPTARPPELDVFTGLHFKKLNRRYEAIHELLQRFEESGNLTPEQAQERIFQLKQLRFEAERMRLTPVRTMVSVKLTSPRKVRVLPRGDWLDESGERVDPAIPEFLGKLKVQGRQPNRLDLANWLFEPGSDLEFYTSRVMVNRLWYLLFGSGISADLQDFGGQGSPPSNPELLDYLAGRLIQLDWNLKAIIREILLSRAYRRSSLVSPAERSKDPENRWFARQGQFRLPAEMVRDNVLSVSGLLLDELGGPSVRPYQPAGYYRHLNFPPRRYRQDRNENQWRRGVYVHWQRQFVHPTFKALDAPTREECTAERSRSNTPLAALSLLNDPSFCRGCPGLCAKSASPGIGGRLSADTIRLSGRDQSKPGRRGATIAPTAVGKCSKQFSKSSKRRETIDSSRSIPG